MHSDLFLEVEAGVSLVVKDLPVEEIHELKLAELLFQPNFMKAILPLLFVIILSPVLGQKSIEIKGKVVDSVSGKPLSFAQIALHHSGLGTTTNEEGVFLLDIPAANQNDSLLIYFLGYETRKMSVSACLFPSLQIFMKPLVLQLSEVDIVGLTPEEVIRRTVVAIPANYGQTPLILTAFIRSQKSVNNKLAEFTEAIIDDYKNGYYLYKPGDTEKKHKQSNIPRLLKGRVTSDTNLVNAIGDIGRNVGCLGCNFTNDMVEFYHSTILDETLFKYYDLSMEELIQPQGGKIYHILFSQKKDVSKRLWKGELFIDAASFALMKITQKPSMYAYDAYEKTKNNIGFTILNKPGWVEEMPFIQQTVVYSKHDTVWLLGSIQIENWMTFTYPPTGQRIKFSYKNDVVVTNSSRDSLKIKNFRGDKILGTTQRWDQIISPQDESFWTSFNYLPVENALKKSIEEIRK